MKNRILTGVIIGGTILTTVVSAYAYNSNNSDGSGLRDDFGKQNPDREAIMEALDNADYQSWYDLTKGSPNGDEILSVINEDNFSKLVEAHKLRESGDFEGAKAIMDDLGLPEMGGPRGGHEKNENMEAVKSALDNNDYNAWLTAIAEMPKFEEIKSIINESNFNQMVEIHQLIQGGDVEGAKKIADELGISDLMPFGRGMGGMRGDMKEIMSAVKDGDYDTFVELIKDKPIANDVLSVVNQDNFYLLKQIQELAQAGSFDEAKAIADKIGLDGKLFMRGKHNKHQIEN